MASDSKFYLYLTLIFCATIIAMCGRPSTCKDVCYYGQVIEQSASYDGKLICKCGSAK